MLINELTNDPTKSNEEILSDLRYADKSLGELKQMRSSFNKLI